MRRMDILSNKDLLEPSGHWRRFSSTAGICTDVSLILVLSVVPIALGAFRS